MGTALAGLRILDLTQWGAGPFATSLLGDLGAEVIKIELPGSGDPCRRMPPHFIQGESAFFFGWNRSKKSLTLNLKSAAGRRIFHELAQGADAVCENFKPGVVKRLGVDYETLHALNPRLVYCSISGFGQTGPYVDRPAFDLVVQAMSGVMSLTGPEGGEPVRVGVPVADIAGGIYAALGVLAALHRRQATGIGELVDLALLDVMLSFLTYHAQYYLTAGEVAQRAGSSHISLHPIRTFATQDGAIVVDAHTDNHFAALCQVLGVEDIAANSRFATPQGRLQNKKALYTLLQEAFLRRPSGEWLERLIEAEIPAGPINTLDRALTDPHALARRMVLEVNHPLCGKIKMVGSPLKMSGDEDDAIGPPPTLGEHTAPILQGLLGYTPEEIARLKEQGVI